MNVQYLINSKGKKTAVVVAIKDWLTIEKRLDGYGDEDYKEPTKAEILEGIKQGLKEVKLHQEGKIKLQSFDEFIKEL